MKMIHNTKNNINNHPFKSVIKPVMVRLVDSFSISLNTDFINTYHKKIDLIKGQFRHDLSCR